MKKGIDLIIKPQKNGNTERLCNEFTRGTEEPGNKVEEIKLNRKGFISARHAGLAVKIADAVSSMTMETKSYKNWLLPMSSFSPLSSTAAASAVPCLEVTTLTNSKWNTISWNVRLFAANLAFWNCCPLLSPACPHFHFLISRSLYFGISIKFTVLCCRGPSYRL